MLHKLRFAASAVVSCLGVLCAALFLSSCNFQIPIPTASPLPQGPNPNSPPGGIFNIQAAADQINNGMCLVRDNVTNLPDPADPTVGQGYAFQMITAFSYEDASSRCADSIFTQLMAEYQTGGTSVQWQVVYFNPSPTIGCAASGCQIYTATLKNAYCVIRDNVTNLPPLGSPVVGKGYAILPIAAATISDVLNQCTPEVYTQLESQYMSGKSRVQLEFAYFDPMETRGCAASGCETVTVPKKNAMCLVRDQAASLPQLTSPNLGIGYAFQPIVAANYDDAVNQCTDSVYNLLMAEFEMGGPSVQLQVAFFGSSATIGCAASGCQSVTLP